jgi:HD-GYP domain-containing protein (c-di-GMP phosphodiesterase class II)
MNTINLSSLEPGSIAPVNFFSAKAELLIAKGATITRRHLEILTDRNIQELYYSPSSEEEEIAHLIKHGIKNLVLSELPEFGTSHSPQQTEPEKPFIPLDLQKVKPGKQGFEELSNSALARGLDENFGKPSTSDQPEGEALKKSATQIPVRDRTEQYKTGVSDSYHTSLKEVESILNLLVSKKNACLDDVSRIVKKFVKIFITDRNILLNISNIRPETDDYLFHHSLNVCLLSINVAASYGYSEKQIVEIGIGALVHDLGMLLVPESVRLKPGKLTADEQYEVQKHPVLGLHLLQNVKGMSDRIAYIAYQVHERENAVGYPKQRASHLIHRFAKMVQVADIYEALTSRRPHRPPFMPCEGVTKIIQMAKAGLIASDAVKAFLEYVSLFPVGSLVLLSNNCIAKVVHANKEALHLPMVSVLTDENSALFEKNKIHQLDLNSGSGILIRKGLPFNFLKNIDVMHGF